MGLAVAVSLRLCVRSLTCHVVYPQRSSKCENIMKASQNIKGLKDEEIVPRLGHVGWVIENSHRQNTLCGEYGDPRCACDPGKDVDQSAHVALHCKIVRTKFYFLFSFLVVVVCFNPLLKATF